MKKLIMPLMALASLLTQTNAAEWLDMTETYIVNPTFANDDVTTGWLGTQFGTANAKENAEHYNKSYNTYQEIKGLAEGHYRVSLKAFYRSGSAVEDYANYNSGNPEKYQHATLYATSSIDNQSTPISLASSAAQPQSLGGGASSVTNEWGGWWGGQNGPFIPNDMQGAYYWFEAGHYDNSVEVNVGNDGTLRIGIRKTTTLNGDWTCLDDWRLEYYGDMVNVVSITIPSTLTIPLGDTRQIPATIKPDNATVKALVWETSDPDVVSVDQNGNITAQGQGTADITATTTDGTDISQTCTVTVEYSGADASEFVINEIMPANVDQFVDPTWNYGGWLELYNPTDHDVNVGRYWVSDDPNDLTMARIPLSRGVIPAHGYRTIWFDHTDTRKDINQKWENTNLDMKLSLEGGTIYISDEYGRLLMSQAYPAAIMRCSYGRKPDGGDTWMWTDTPTPDATNNTSTFATEQTQIPEPIVDQPGQLFSGSLTISVTIPLGMRLAYTTNGSSPTLKNSKIVVNTSTKNDLVKKFTINTSTTYRFRLFSKTNAQLPSKVVTRSYILNDKDYYLPIVSLVTDSINLYDDTLGIYVTGKNGKTANQDGTRRNFNMEWERPASFEFIDNRPNVPMTPDTNTDGGYFCQEIDIAINGGWSRKYEPRSFKLKAAKVYDLKNSLDYPFFEDKPYNKNKSLILRNGGNDEYNQTRLKDAALQEVARQSDFPLNLQSYQPVHVFINGKYLAMLNLREPSNKNYAYANYGYDTDEVDAFEMSVDSGYVQKAGTKEAFREWYTLAKSADDDLIYQQILDRVDIDDYINYMAFKFFLNDWDWPHNNCKGFRSRLDGKFHFVVYDLDNCVDRNGNNIFNDFANKRTHTFYSRPEYNNTSITAEVELVTIFLNMLKNETFRRRFIDTYCIVGGTVFGDEAAIEETVYRLADNIATALSWEKHSPYGYGRSFAGGIVNATTGTYRYTMTNVLRNYSTFGLGGKEIQAAQLSSNVEGAPLAINGINVPRGKFNGYLFAPITFTASTPAGYRFAGWYTEGANATQQTTIFPKGAEWKYYEAGSLDDEDWTSLDYNASAWSTGYAPFGYGNAGRPMANAATPFSRTNANGQRIPTYYLRREFTLDKKPAASDTYTLHYDIDDGMIAYVNGQEVGLYHMWSGATYDQTCQSTGNSNWYEGDTPYSSTLTIDGSLLRKGRNVIAIEVHNCNATSSDIWCDAELTATKTADGRGGYVSTDPSYTMPAFGDVDIMAIYEPLTEEELAEAHITPIRINEVSAANNVNVNDYYKKDDWIELYNTTDEDIDLEGMYLTDKRSVPHKYQIERDPDCPATSTIIPAHGYKIIWCSKREQISGELHANFKLDNEDGKMVRIEAADGTWADSLVYCHHEGNQSVGRYPDGSNDVFLMTTTTIRRNNVLGSYATPWVAPEGGTDDSEDAIRGIDTDTAKRSTDFYTIDGKRLGNKPTQRGIYVIGGKKVVVR